MYTLSENVTLDQKSHTNMYMLDSVTLLQYKNVNNQYLSSHIM